MNRKKRPEGKWKLDDQGRFDNRSIAEMIATSLFYAKPRAIAESDYDRVVDIVEEELIVIESIGDQWRRDRIKGKDGHRDRDAPCGAPLPHH